jgi:GMP synthase (glutamine-hydrolysing)
VTRCGQDDYVCALRAVTSTRRHDRRLLSVPARIAVARRDPYHQRVRGINRVVYDVTGKPTGTIEWE